MMEPFTPRCALPLLAAGQAAKELTHNEALARLDLLVQPAIEARGINTPPDAPLPGQCWIVGTAPAGAWQGHAGELAGWTDGGWRFAAPGAGFTAWNVATARPVLFRNGQWREGELTASRLLIDDVAVVGPRAAAIANPAGGTSIDQEARATLRAILTALRGHGLIAS